MWNLDDGSVEFSEALVAAVEWLPDVPHNRHGLVAGLHSDDRAMLVAALDRAIEKQERFTVVARGYLDGPASSSACSSGAARCSATPPGVPRGCSARSATSPSSTTTAPS